MDGCVVVMHLDAAQSQPQDRLLDHRVHTVTVAHGVDHREAGPATRIGTHQRSDVAIPLRIVRLEYRQQNRMADTRFARPACVSRQRCRGVPGTGHAIALPGVDVEVEDHGAA